MKEIGNRLKLLRQTLSLDQIDVARVMGVAQGNYSLREKGDFEMSTKHLLALKKAYKVNLNWLIAGEGEMFEVTPLKDINDKLDKLIKKAGTPRTR